jgi:hypothetical protein
MSAAVEQIGTGSKKVRGMAQVSLDLIDAMHDAAAAAHPITGRGVGYKLFVQELIASMSTNDMQRVYRLLKEARERGIIPWDWIVDENRTLERVSTWDDPDEYARCVAQSYRRDFWNQQPHRVEVWSEKGTIRGVLQPVLDKYGVGFRNMIGFTSATIVNDISRDGDNERLLHALYVGDFDPSGLYMSERDLPNRLARYGGDHVAIKGLRFYENSSPSCRLSRHPTRKRTLDTSGLSRTTAIAVGSWTRWTPTTCATA